ncbi:hypothetical protein DIZ76_013742 [Coccidioides immitis]|nr:hypothetical protein DIZ76_013742 [Coccidioides immitis]
MTPPPSTSFSPSDILPATLSRLLALYPDTARNVCQAKLEAKSKASKNDIDKQVRSFVDLDNWRYEVLSATLKHRAEGQGPPKARPAKRVKKAADASDELHLKKDELVQLMEWKLKHGSFRPALMNLIRSNPEPAIYTATSDAASSLPTTTVGNDADADALFPSLSLEVLTKSLRGVGPATASLILSASTAGGSANQVPFFSDEMYWWLCSHRYPSPANPAGPLKPPPKLKYTMKEYRELWGCARELKARLDNLDDNHLFSMQDIEKAAFVIGHFECSGYATAAANPDPKTASSKAANEGEDNEQPVIQETDVGNKDGKPKKRKRKH